ncbi:helix-turn-helix domain-containing protein [Vibrio europaeus]|uniref:GlxA family transcriptional regulator n=1 Tax=Vibrio europaeus TaxID=300876 RepID=UPI00233E6549|nr:helix-turn-helix domain-containing protein [Vibrio europaeus]MDC5721865.1 helix-turn-helix domain-containing protein [Vibrio europaeus]MDC5758252.1 helix-turn-helix domain-containing protein [Vibrio europaeus]MDC5776529.1 helix-turn-helix domain-containing protein [Vibrio europaeus]MDC5795612.1 helix-turn-helix domain-containing protein [Vibrio europaeus]MDC5801555.1 helix-turn-helix domain-containing protein [Vibrio europaeus]
MLTPLQPLRITALLLEGMPTTAISGPLEMLTIAAQLAGHPAPEISYVSPHQGPIASFAGFTLSNITHWPTVNDADIVLIGSCGEPDSRSYQLPDGMKQWLKKQIAQCKYVICMCTGAFLLAELGVLNRRSATTHWVQVERFRHLYPDVKLMPHRNVTHDGPFICTSGIREYYEATILLIDALFGAAHREKCEQFMGGNFSNQPLCLTSFAQYRQHSDELIHGLQDWMHDAEPSALSVALCAEKSFLSERQMKRRFKAATGESPMNYIQRIRIAIAREKLETTKLNIDQICQQVGYSDTNHFRLLFRKFHEMTPTQYRKVTQLCASA